MSRFQLFHLINTCLLLDRITTNLIPIKPFDISSSEEPTFEVSEFPGTSERDLNPYVNYLNHLYIYPHALSFESQKIFSRARNIAVTVEVRMSDDLDSKPLEVRMKILFTQHIILKKIFSIQVHLSSSWRHVTTSLCLKTFMSCYASQHNANLV